MEVFVVGVLNRVVDWDLVVFGILLFWVCYGDVYIVFGCFRFDF